MSLGAGLNLGLINPHGVLDQYSPLQDSPLVWLDAELSELYKESEGGLATEDTDNVGSIIDLSGNDNHASAGGTGTLKLNQLNGKRVIRFNGTNSSFYIPSLEFGPFLILAVWRNTAAGIIYEHSENSNDSGGGCYLHADATYAALVRRTSIATINKAASWGMDNTWRITTHEYTLADAESHKLKNLGVDIAGALSANGNPTLDALVHDFYIGARAGSSLFMNGDLFALAIFDQITDVDAMVSRLVTYYQGRTGL